MKHKNRIDDVMRQLCLVSLKGEPFLLSRGEAQKLAEYIIEAGAGEEQAEAFYQMYLKGFSISETLRVLIGVYKTPVLVEMAEALLQSKTSEEFVKEFKRRWGDEKRTEKEGNSKSTDSPACTGGGGPFRLL